MLTQDGTLFLDQVVWYLQLFLISHFLVDDRTKEELGLEPLKNNKFVINKSRYDSTDCYIYPCSAPYNDIQLEHDPTILKQLIDGGIDEHLASHIAHMFIRDPLQVQIKF